MDFVITIQTYFASFTVGSIFFLIPCNEPSVTFLCSFIIFTIFYTGFRVLDVLSSKFVMLTTFSSYRIIISCSASKDSEGALHNSLATDLRISSMPISELLASLNMIEALTIAALSIISIATFCTTLLYFLASTKRHLIRLVNSRFTSV